MAPRLKSSLDITRVICLPDCSWVLRFRYHSIDIYLSGIGEVRIVSCVALEQAGMIYTAMESNVLDIILLPIRPINFQFPAFQADGRETYPIPVVVGFPPVTLTRVSADAGFPLQQYALYCSAKPPETL